MLNFDIEKYKWILILIVAIFLIFTLINNNQENFDVAPTPTIAAPEAQKTTLRTKSDFYTEKADSEELNKIIHLKCSNKKEVRVYYYLTSLDTKFNNCNQCNISSDKKHMPALINVKNTIKSDCINQETITCLNSQDIPNCGPYAKNQCKKSSKISLDNCQFILEHYDGADKESDADDYYLLRTTNKQKQILSLVELPTATKVDEKEIKKQREKGIITIVPKKYTVCFENNEKDTSKIYIDEEDLDKDKVKFRLYFIVQGQKRYLGTCDKNSEICDDIGCKNVNECKKNIRYFCSYVDKKHKNVLIFEPEFVGIQQK